MKFLKFIILAIAGFSLTCCEQILDKKDLSAVNEFDVWNDLELATAYVNRIYAQALPSWNDDYSNYCDEADGGGNYMYGQLTENSVNYWPYDEIREINILLVNIDKGTLNEPDRKLLKGQALFFRAWLYFEMVRLYGGVPLILEPQELTDDLLVKRSPTSVVIAQIITDLDNAISFLPDIKATSGSNDGHLHKGTAMAVKGRVLLYYASPQFDPAQSAGGRWQAAYEANKTAKDYLVAQGYGLHADFGALWISEMSKEAIFVKRYKYLSTNSASYHNWTAATRPLDASQGATGANRPALEMVTAFPMKDGKAIKSGTSAYTYDSVYFWKNRDPRFTKTIVYNGALWQLNAQAGRIQWTYVGGEQNNPTITGFYMRKAVDENQTAIEAYNSGTDWIEIRFAEVLLNLAEAANESGKTPEAYTELVAIRKRAGIDAGTNNLYGLDQNMTKELMRKAIMLERKIELAYEGKRYWDLRRCRLFESELNGTRRHGYTVSLKVPTAQWNDVRNSMTSPQLLTHLDQKYGDYFKHTYKLLDTQFDIKWKAEYYFFAIPAEHLQLNSNLEQTLGWAGGTFDPLK